MSMNVEFFVKVDEIIDKTENYLGDLRKVGYMYFDKDGREIDAYYRPASIKYKYFIVVGDKKLGLDDIKSIFKDRHTLNIDFSIAGDRNLLISCHFDDKEQLLVAVNILSEFLYDIFDKELEF